MLLKKALSLLFISAVGLFIFSCTSNQTGGNASIPSGDTIKIVQAGDNYMAEIPISDNGGKTNHKVLLKVNRVDTPWVLTYSRVDTMQKGTKKVNLPKVPASRSGKVSSGRIDTPAVAVSSPLVNPGKVVTPALFNFIVVRDCTITK